MKADERNVAVVHCLTGKGRTSTILAAFLCWMGEAGEYYYVVSIVFPLNLMAETNRSNALLSICIPI